MSDFWYFALPTDGWIVALSSNFYKKYTFRTWNAVEISYNEIYCRKGKYFSFDFSLYSIHLDIVC